MTDDKPDTESQQPEPDPRPTIANVPGGSGILTLTPDPEAIQRMVIEPDPRRTFFGATKGTSASGDH